MTLEMMRDFGVESSYEGATINIEPQKYRSLEYRVESDWSSASYLFEIVALSDNAELELTYFTDKNLQADAELKDFCYQFGVAAELDDEVLLIKSTNRHYKEIEHNFIQHPDLTQTIAVICAGKGISIKYKGLKTLHIKETDRVAALRNCLLYTSPSPRDATLSRMPSSA